MVLDTIFEPLAIASLQKPLEQTIVLDTIFEPLANASLQKPLEQTIVLDTIFEPLALHRFKNHSNRHYLKIFLARFGSFSNSPLIKASFLARDHFFNCFSIEIALVTSVNSA